MTRSEQNVKELNCQLSALQLKAETNELRLQRMLDAAQHEIAGLHDTVEKECEERKYLTEALSHMKKELTLLKQPLRGSSKNNSPVVCRSRSDSSSTRQLMTPLSQKLCTSEANATSVSHLLTNSEVFLPRLECVSSEDLQMSSKSYSQTECYGRLPVGASTGNSNNNANSICLTLDRDYAKSDGHLRGSLSGYRM
jgi:hypothetical protein